MERREDLAAAVKALNGVRAGKAAAGRTGDAGNAAATAALDAVHAGKMRAAKQTPAEVRAFVDNGGRPGRERA